LFVVGSLKAVITCELFLFYKWDQNYNEEVCNVWDELNLVELGGKRVVCVLMVIVF